MSKQKKSISVYELFAEAKNSRSSSVRWAIAQITDYYQEDVIAFVPFEPLPGTIYSTEEAMIFDSFEKADAFLEAEDNQVLPDFWAVVDLSVIERVYNDPSVVVA